MSTVLVERPSLSLRAPHRRLFICVVGDRSIYACVSTTTGKALASAVAHLDATYRQADAFEIHKSNEPTGSGLALHVGRTDFEISEREAAAIVATFGAHGLKIESKEPR